MLTLEEFHEKTKGLPKDTPITVLRVDGELDYACLMWLSGPGQETNTDDGKLAIVIAPILLVLRADTSVARK
jgi:hypothetical protein